MKKNLLFLGFDVLLFSQFLIVAIIGLIEHHHPPTLHGVMGLVLIVCSFVHLSLHWRWIDNALHRYNQMPGVARTNAQLVLILFCGYLICGLTGLLASASSFHLLGHPIKHLHQFFGLIVISTQSIHLARHRKWIQTTFMRAFFSAGPDHRKTSYTLPPSD